MEDNATRKPSGLNGLLTTPGSRWVKMRFQIVEYHTIIKEVPADEFDAVRRKGDPADWLNNRFENSDFSDCEIETGEMGLDEWEIISENVKSSRCEPVGSIVQLVLGQPGGETRIDYLAWFAPFSADGVQLASVTDAKSFRTVASAPPEPRPPLKIILMDSITVKSSRISSFTSSLR